MFSRNVRSDDPCRQTWRWRKPVGRLHKNPHVSVTTAGCLCACDPVQRDQSWAGKRHRPKHVTVPNPSCIVSAHLLVFAAGKEWNSGHGSSPLQAAVLRTNPVTEAEPVPRQTGRRASANWVSPNLVPLSLLTLSSQLIQRHDKLALTLLHQHRQAVLLDQEREQYIPHSPSTNLLPGSASETRPVTPFFALAGSQRTYHARFEISHTYGSIITAL